MVEDSNKTIVDRKGMRIGKQIVLPLSKAIEIAMKSLRIRFWRSMITMSGIVLAIAFLMYIWTGDSVINKLTSLKAEEIGENVKERVNLLLQKKGIEAGSEAENERRAKSWWLIVLSLLVCVVGITNAMLMSVTERVKEIGTMKCLGALDGFIVKLFLLESSFQGMVATFLGILIGLVLSLIVSWISFTDTEPTTGKWIFYTFKYFPALGIVLSALWSFIIGSGLSVLAAIGPAYRAAKMEPVDAMRVEE